MTQQSVNSELDLASTFLFWCLFLLTYLSCHILFKFFNFSNFCCRLNCSYGVYSTLKALKKKHLLCNFCDSSFLRFSFIIYCFYCLANTTQNCYSMKYLLIVRLVLILICSLNNAVVFGILATNYKPFDN